MTVDNTPENYQGLFYSRAAAEHAAQQMQAEGRDTKIIESILHANGWVVYAAPLHENSEPQS